MLALAWLSTAQDPNALEAWPSRWRAALEKRFPDEWRDLAVHAGDGLRQLLERKLDLDQATRICNLSLLRGRDLGSDHLHATGRRLLVEALRPLESAARAKPGA